MQATCARPAALLPAIPAVAVGMTAPAEAGQQDDRRGRTGTWATAAGEHYDVSGMPEVTVRMPVHTGVVGSSVRIRPTNAQATEPVPIGHATVGMRDGAGTAGDAFTWTTTSWPFLSGVDVTAHSQRLGAAYDSGDHPHPNDAGMKAFADSIDLTSLGLGRGCS